MKSHPPITPDGRYFVVNGRLWRCTNPFLPSDLKEQLIKELMHARRVKGEAMHKGDAAAREAARQIVDQAKHKLGERGPVWWTDGAKDWNRHMASNTPYAQWFLDLDVGLARAAKS